MSRTIQSTQQMRGAQIPQVERKKFQDGHKLPHGGKKHGNAQKGHGR